MEIISALGGITPLHAPWLEEPELKGAEKQRIIRSMAKSEKFLAENTLSLSHISSWTPPSSLCLREHTIPPSPHGSQDKVFGRRAKKHDAS